MWKSSIGIDPWPAVHIPVPCDHGPTTAYWTTFTLVVKSFANSDGWTTCIHKSGSWNDPKQRWGCLATKQHGCLQHSSSALLDFYFIKPAPQLWLIMWFIMYEVLRHRVSGDPRSCQMDRRTISTNIDSWFSCITCKRRPDGVSGRTLRWFCQPWLEREINQLTFY